MRVTVGLAILAALLVVAPTPARAQTDFPIPEGYVVDTAAALRPETADALERELADYDTRTTNEIAVAVVRTTGGLPIEDYALQLFNFWGVGQADKNNGVLLVVAVDDRVLRIQVGTGLEAQLPDIRAKTIVQEQLVPRLKEGNVDGAVTAGVANIRQSLGDPAAPPVPAPPGGFDDEQFAEEPASDDSDSGTDPAVVWAWILGLGLPILLGAVWYYSNRCPRCGTKMFVAGSRWTGDREDVCSKCGFRREHRENQGTFYGDSGFSSSSFGGGSFGGSSFGGGGGGSSGGGFGGGSSSGGGASGSW